MKPQLIKDAGSKFFIDPTMETKYPQLIALIKETESMDDNEKQYWLDVGPQMTDEQIDRLFTILDQERLALLELEKKYQDRIMQLNRTHLLEWQEIQKQPASKA
jgi:hypothetical protein